MKIEDTGLNDQLNHKIHQGDIIEYYHWCYMFEIATKEQHKIYYNSCGFDYYHNPLIGIVKWNNKYSTHEPLLKSNDKWNNTCFNDIIKEKEDEYNNTAYCKIIGNINQNPELVKKIKEKELKKKEEKEKIDLYKYEVNKILKNKNFTENFNPSLTTFDYIERCFRYYFCSEDCHHSQGCTKNNPNCNNNYGCYLKNMDEYGKIINNVEKEIFINFNFKID